MANLRERLNRMMGEASPRQPQEPQPREAGASNTAPWAAQSGAEEQVEPEVEARGAEPGRGAERKAASAAEPGYRVLEAVFPAHHCHGCALVRGALEHLAPLLWESGVTPRPGPAVYLDTETTGLSTGAGVMAFLIGLGWFEGDSFRVRQYFLSQPAGEKAMLAELLPLVREAGLLVSFNGRSFDVPMLRSRLALNRMREPLDAPHLDLLYPARRMWKLRLRQCNLTRLEEQTLDFAREGDVDGAEIPGLYFAYLRDGDEGRLAAVFEHNRLDILALAALAGRMGANLDRPELAGEELDQFSLGRMYQRQGDVARAERCYRRAEGCSRQDYALLLKRQGRMAEAEMRWRAMVEAGQGGIAPMVELAKYYEHRLRDYAGALAWTRRALETDPDERGELRRRESRLQRKINDGGNALWG